MGEQQILKEDVTETVYELVDPCSVNAVIRKGLLPAHCIFIDTNGDYQEETELFEKSETKGYLWQYDETIALLNLIEQHYESIQHARKRQVVWKNISHELQLQQCSVDAETCRRKWRNLIRSYNVIQHNGGSGKIVKFQFYNEIHNILSKGASDKSQGHVEESQIDLHNYAAKYKSEKDEKSAHKNTDKRYNSTKENDNQINGPSTSIYASTTEISEEPETDVVITYVEKKSRATQTASCITSTKARSRVQKKKNSFLSKYVALQERYLQRDRLWLRHKIKERRKENHAKERRFQEKLSLKKEQLELDKKKVQLFEQYLNLKMYGNN